VTPKTHMIGFVIIAGAVLLATTSALLNVANQVSAQITPSASSVNELGFMAQNTTDPVQNTTAANITQLATVLPTVDQPIAPTSFAPVSEESDESTSSSDDDDDDDSNSDNSHDDSGNDDDGDDDDDGGGNDDDDGDGRSASAGGAFASAG
jgi:hypothetical protein